MLRFRTPIVLCGSLLALARTAEAFQCPPAANIWYVDANVGGGLNNGTSWTNAFSSLDSGLAAAAGSAADDEVRVAEGTYVPGVMTNPPDPRSASFVIPAFTLVRGAWRAGQTGNTPVGSAAATILTGDIGVPASVTDNTYHVVSYLTLGDPFDVAALRDLTVRDGYAVSSSFVFNEHIGAGIYTALGSLRVEDCLVLSNTAQEWGGGLASLSTYLEVVGCTFEWNSAGANLGAGFGGGLYSGEWARIVNCRFLRNSANDGAGLYLDRPAIVANRHKVLGCLFQSNGCLSVGGYGGAVFVGNPAGQLVRCDVLNCTMTNNAAGATAGLGGGVGFLNSNGITVKNSIVWNNTASADAQIQSGLGASVDWCTVKAGYAGGTNISTLPPMLNGLGIPNVASPVVDQGQAPLPLDVADCDSDCVTSVPWPLDLAGRPRVRGPFPDQGAYEVQ